MRVGVIDFIQSYVPDDCKTITLGNKDKWQKRNSQYVLKTLEERLCCKIICLGHLSSDCIIYNVSSKGELTK